MLHNNRQGPHDLESKKQTLDDVQAQIRMMFSENQCECGVSTFHLQRLRGQITSHLTQMLRPIVKTREVPIVKTKKVPIAKKRKVKHSVTFQTRSTALLRSLAVSNLNDLNVNDP